MCFLLFPSLTKTEKTSIFFVFYVKEKLHT